MALRTLLLGAFSLALLSYGQPEALENHNPSDLLCTCNQIALAISDASQVFFPSAPEYLSDIEHATPSSTEVSACSVEPGSAEDVGVILRILGSTRTPFAVKGGGHAFNPGFSSTRGVQIAMTRFNETKVNSMTSTVDAGAGLIWDQVYKTLEPIGVNVLGGRLPGIGVAGLTLGGGYSFLSSQYGLTLDNVAGYELVLPNGTVTNVTSEDDDLWFGLRGGFNNFGIVTKFILKSYPQGDVWGGIRFYSENQLGAIREAFFKFQQKNDTKAEAAVSLSYSSGQVLCAVLFFYDAPAPSGVFDDLLDIPATGGNVSTASFFDFFQSLSAQGGVDSRRIFGDTVSVIQYSPAVFDAFVDQTKLWGARLLVLDESATLTLTQEPFGKGIFSHGSGSAYPPDRSHVIAPSALTIAWSNASLDDTIAFALRNISNSIRAAALADGQDVSRAALYPNYAIFGTPLEDIYGGNVERLRKIRAKIDPKDVLGLAGGWKF
ncbi:FAD-binding domain-containing protein [Russula ochroleuca]|uniref:FAD-binding domain-containing protein n=1 Tax=Russula ochroleuca TaxID=152965 RepID=A0A9P5T923_9AGAM|nr:FAD-binding domain-containing protein [Russula ochroleuca]